jgi:hypothetical protein
MDWGSFSQSEVALIFKAYISIWWVSWRLHPQVSIRLSFLSVTQSLHHVQCTSHSSLCDIRRHKICWPWVSLYSGGPELGREPRPRTAPHVTWWKSGESWMECSPWLPGPSGNPLSKQLSPPARAVPAALKEGEATRWTRLFRNTGADGVRTTQEATEQLQNMIKITWKVHWFCSKTASTSLCNNCPSCSRILYLSYKGVWVRQHSANRPAKTMAQGWRDTLIMS